MIYHYTDPDSARAALGAGILRARPVVVYDTLFGAYEGPGTVLAPAVWFTTRQEPAPTILARMLLDGWSLSKPGVIWRIAVADDVAPDDLVAWAEPHRYHPALFRMMIATARVAGESWEDWRLSPVDVPAARWAAVQSWHEGRWRGEIRPTA